MANHSTIFLPKPQETVPGASQDAGKEDSELWDDFREGDKSAFAYIYVRFFPVLYYYGCRISNDKDLVRDCIQDLFLELSNNRARLSPTTSVRYYLYRCIRRKIALKVSGMQRYRLEPLENEHGETRESVILPMEFQDIELENNAEQRMEILKALESLTKKQRKVIQLRFFEDMTHKEISATMSISINTVYNLISLATSALRTVIRRVPVVALFLLRFFFNA